jgi:hypothetical protein
MQAKVFSKGNLPECGLADTLSGDLLNCQVVRYSDEMWPLFQNSLS